MLNRWPFSEFLLLCNSRLELSNVFRQLGKALEFVGFGSHQGEVSEGIGELGMALTAHAE